MTMTGDKKAATLLEDVAALVESDEDTHGDAVENQQHIATGWTWYLRGTDILGPDERLTGDDVAMMMALVKSSRHAVGDASIEHLRDVAGYAGIGGACMVDRGNVDQDDLTVDDYGEHK